MNADEKEFLFREWDISWEHLRAMDERRFMILSTFTGFCVAITGASVAGVVVVGQGSPFPFLANAIILLSAFMISLLAFCCGKMLESERRASERYRNKINLLRNAFIGKTDDPMIAEYLKKGKDYSVRLDILEPKTLSILNVFDKRKHSTALFAKVFIQVIGDLSFCAFLATLAWIAIG